MRWDDWFFHPEFQIFYNKVSDLYKNNSSYRHAIELNINEFLTRFFLKNKLDNNHYSNAQELCLAYLLEECAVMCLWVYGQYDFELYPSGRNQAMHATYEKLIKAQYPLLLRSVTIRFKKYNKVVAPELNS